MADVMVQIKWVANTPRPPAAPQISTRSPPWRSHCVSSMRYAVK